MKHGKKTNGSFDITIGAFDGAEVAKLVGLFILNQLESKFPQLNAGLYRDDSLASHKKMSGPEVERIKNSF